MNGRRPNPEAPKPSSAFRRVGLWVMIFAFGLGGALAIDLSRQALAKDRVQWRPLTAMAETQTAVPTTPLNDQSVAALPIQAPTTPAPLGEGKPLLIRFTADWCHACTDMKARVFAETKVADRIHKRFEPYSVDMTSPTPRQASLAQRHRVTFLPTLLITDGRGNELARMERAASSPEEFLEWLDRGEARWSGNDGQPE